MFLKNVLLRKIKQGHVQEYCPNGTKEDCFKDQYERGMLHTKCEKIHFKRILKLHTDSTQFFHYSITLKYLSNFFL